LEYLEEGYTSDPRSHCLIGHEIDVANIGFLVARRAVRVDGAAGVIWSSGVSGVFAILVIVESYRTLAGSRRSRWHGEQYSVPVSGRRHGAPSAERQAQAAGQRHTHADIRPAARQQHKVTVARR